MAANLIPRTVTFEEFLAGIDDKDLYARCEYWDGEIVPKDPDFGEAVSPVKYHSFIQGKLITAINNYLETNPIGTAHTELHWILPVGRRAFVPDILVTLGPLVDIEEPLRQPPALAVEIISPSDRAATIAHKLDAYLANGVQLVWIIDLKGREAWAHRPGKPHETISPDGFLDGGEVLPGFRVALAALFPPS